MKKQFELWNIMDLQLFADGGEESGATETESSEVDGEKKEAKQQEPKGKMYTQEEVNQIISQRVAREKSKSKQEIDEAKKLANMDTQQKIEYERDKLQRELDELKKANALSDMSRQARKMLSDGGINVSDDLLTMLVSAEADKTKTSVDSFIKLFNDHVENAVKERLKGNAPKRGSNGKLTKSQIMDIKDPLERQKKIAENIELFSR